MAFKQTTEDNWRNAFDSNFVYAIILATFLLFNGLSFLDYLYYTPQVSLSLINGMEHDYSTNVVEICVQPNKKPVQRQEIHFKLSEEKEIPKKIKRVNPKTPKQIIETSEQSFLAPVVATPRPVNVRNTTHYNSSITTHTNITTPQNKTFIRSEKSLSKSSTINLEKLPEISFLLSDLITTANNQGKNIILSFGAKWCLPCKQMDKNVYASYRVKQSINENYIFQKLNDKDLESITLKNLYDVTVYPTTLIIDGRGNVINKFEESISKDRMLNILADNSSRTRGDIVVKVDSSSQPVELNAAIEFLVDKSTDFTLDFD